MGETRVFAQRIAIYVSMNRVRHSCRTDTGGETVIQMGKPKSQPTVPLFTSKHVQHGIHAGLIQTGKNKQTSKCIIIYVSMSRVRQSCRTDTGGAKTTTSERTIIYVSMSRVRQTCWTDTDRAKNNNIRAYHYLHQHE